VFDLRSPIAGPLPWRALTTRRGTPTALTIAGSDSGGGAGIQADLKAFARCGVHGMTAVTAVTVQNTTGVAAVHLLPPEVVRAQVRAVAADIGVDAVKVGMVGSAEIARAVAQALAALPEGTPVVVDPVMVAESGATLLEEDAQRVLVEELVPRATVLTPNLPEARALAETGTDSGDTRSARIPETASAASGGLPASVGRPAGEPHAVERTEQVEDVEAEDLARAVLALGPWSVVLTGGHRARAVDLYVDAEGAVVEIPGARHPDGAAHGSGCTHSAVLAAALALGQSPMEAARTARRLAGEAVARGLRDVGAGAGPVDVLGLAPRRSDIIEGR
jgi:hydroxymethylpyrimidine/phosphomethylpyrimidine kinase